MVVFLGTPNVDFGIGITVLGDTPKGCLAPAGGVNVVDWVAEVAVAAAAAAACVLFALLLLLLDSDAYSESVFFSLDAVVFDVARGVEKYGAALDWSFGFVSAFDSLAEDDSDANEAYDDALDVLLLLLVTFLEGGNGGGGKDFLTFALILFSSFFLSSSLSSSFGFSFLVEPTTACSRGGDRFDNLVLAVLLHDCRCIKDEE